LNKLDYNIEVEPEHEFQIAERVILEQLNSEEDKKMTG